VSCAFLPRHGRGHVLNPSEINQRANIYALKSLGISQIVSFTASGSLREEIRPKDFVIPEQVFDKTKFRPSTFFEKGIVAHISMAQPFCNEIRDLIRQSVCKLEIKHHFCGTYVCIEGPQFSTKIESEINRRAGFSVVGMTIFPEAKLAREAEMCYANISLITDYDAWKEGEEVTNSAVIETVIANIENSGKVVKDLVVKLSQREIKCMCGSSLEKSLMTSPDKVLSNPYYENVSLLIDKYYKK